MRRYILDNALAGWRDFHLDGLRLDAVHALQDSSADPPAGELADEVSRLSEQLGRPLPLIAESDLNDPIMITPADEHLRRRPGYGLDAQWDDDVHHVLHAMLSGERHGYYADFGELPSLAKVFTRAFFHDGTLLRVPRPRRTASRWIRQHTPGWRFVVFLQNHDQIGNRAAGDRLPEIVSPGLLRVGAMLLLTSPVHPDAVHGRGVGGQHPVAVLHLPSGARAGRGGERGPAGRVRRPRLGHLDAMPDPQDPAAYR